MGERIFMKEWLQSYIKKVIQLEYFLFSDEEPLYTKQNPQWMREEKTYQPGNINIYGRIIAHYRSLIHWQQFEWVQNNVMPNLKNLYPDPSNP